MTLYNALISMVNEKENVSALGQFIIKVEIAFWREANGLLVGSVTTSTVNSHQYPVHISVFGSP